MRRPCKNGVRKLGGAGSAFDNPVMRIAVIMVLAICAGALSASTAVAGTPTLRVTPGPSLTVQGAGFVPRSLVRLRVTDSGVVLRVVSVRAGARGGFLVRFPSLETCSPTAITATGPGVPQTRVPLAWFVRECPPPPPLAPAPNPGY